MVWDSYFLFSIPVLIASYKVVRYLSTRVEGVADQCVLIDTLLINPGCFSKSTAGYAQVEVAPGIDAQFQFIGFARRNDIGCDGSFLLPAA